MTDDPRAEYAAAGVSIAAGEALVDAIAPLASTTARPGSAPALGGFGAVFDLAAAGHRDALLVASTDGVGTKLRLAIELHRHDTIGTDLVAMCVNDVLAQGAEPLFFLDYYAAGKLSPDVAGNVIAGIAAGCREARCALIGGETAEMPGHYAGGDYDLAGFVVGAVPRDRLLPSAALALGDVLLALPSSGAHANGFSLIRKLARDRRWELSAGFEDTTLADTLLAPTRIYVRPVLDALERHGEAIRAMAHITGGGLTGNVPRMLQPGMRAVIDRARLPKHPLMSFLKHEGGFDDASMEATFNCGVGLVIAVEERSAGAVAETLVGAGEKPVHIGHIAPREAGEDQCLIL